MAQNAAQEEEALRQRVQQGLQKRKRCSLCMQYFYVEELPGAITYKSILELRQKWGVDVRKNNRLPSPSQLYKREELCVFCMQFFNVDAAEEAADEAHGKSVASGGAAGSPGATMMSNPRSPTKSPKPK